MTRQRPRQTLVACCAGLGGLALLLPLPAPSRQEEANTTIRSVPAVPPVIALKSKAGPQRATQGSYCVFNGQVEACADMVDPEPRRLSIVRPRERLVIRVKDSKIATGVVFVRPRGCERKTVETFDIGHPGTAWRARKRPGKYELEVFVTEFATADGRSGDTSGALGILVAKKRARDVIDAGDKLSCRR